MKPIKKCERAKLARRLSKKINTVLSVYNMKQVELAADIGVNHVTFSSWCRGQSCPRTRSMYDEVMNYLDATYDTGAPIDPQHDLFKIPRRTHVVTTETPGVDISTPTLGVSASTNSPMHQDPNPITGEVSQWRRAVAPLPVCKDEITGIADDTMERAAAMYNMLVGGPGMTPKQGRSFLEIIEMLKSQ
jgi:hypothetical protein